MKAKKKSEPFFSANLPPEELEEILQKIDDNLSTHPLHPNQTDPRPEGDLYTLPIPPEPPDFLGLVTEIRNARAPYYVVSGNFVAKIIKWLHNMVMKVFGRKQAYFNEHTLNLLQALGAELQGRQEYIRKQALLVNILAREIRTQREKIVSLESGRRQPLKKTKLKERIATKRIAHRPVNKKA